MTDLKQLTVGDLKKALEGVPDNVEITVDSDDCNPDVVPTMARYVNQSKYPSLEIYGVSYETWEEEVGEEETDDED